MSRLPALLLLVGLAGTLQAEEAGSPESDAYAPEDLENYYFGPDAEPDPPEITPLSVGQKFILRTQRDEFRELVARKLGILSLKGDARDLRALQSLYDRRVLDEDDVKEWQNAGVWFGDILVAELDLHWISYEDEIGTSKALRYKDSPNYVFPITVFSKRLQFGDEIDVLGIFNKISADIEAAQEHEARLRPRPER